MMEIVKFDPPKEFSYGNTVTKIIDGEPVEFVDIDALSAAQRARYFHVAEQKEVANSREASATIVIPFRRP